MLVQSSVQLYNIESDPTETTNRAQEMPSVVAELTRILIDFNNTAVPPLQVNPKPGRPAPPRFR